MTYKIDAIDYFEKKLKKLRRKYPRITDDYRDLLDELEKNPFVGDRLRECIGPVFKIRMASQDMQKGKSGGFRVIYLVKADSFQVFLITLYPKGERENINAKEINEILKKEGLVD